MTADTIANHITRLQRRRLVVKQIHQAGQLTRGTIAALWRTAQRADTYRLMRWAMEKHDSECDCDQCAIKRARRNK